MQKNIFITGKEVTGDSMIGYHRHIVKLKKELLENSNNISITGIKKFGKTSLAKEVLRQVRAEYDNKLVILSLDLANYKFFFEMLKGLYLELFKETIRNRELKEDFVIDNYMKLFPATDPEKERISYQNYLEAIFSQLHYLGYKVILMIDEFDQAADIFEGTTEYEFLRNLSSQSDINVILLLISRRQLYMIEKKNINNSTFHGIVNTHVLDGFDESDLDEYFNILKERYNIELGETQIAQMHYYAGISPFIWSLLGHDLVEMSPDSKIIDISVLYRQRIIDIENYYKSIYANLSNDKIEADGAMAECCSIEKLIATVIGPKIDLTKNDINYLIQMGYLSDAGSVYTSISGHFTEYLRQKNYLADSWTSVIAVEKKIKALVRKEIQKAVGEREITYGDWEYYLTIAGQDNAMSTYDTFVENSIKDFNKNVDLLDVMALKVTIVLMKYNWEQMFSAYFNYDEWNKWAHKLETISKARNPLAHGHEEYLTFEDKCIVDAYCQELLNLFQKNGSCDSAEVIEKRYVNEKRLSYQDTYYKLAHSALVDSSMPGNDVDFSVAVQSKRGTYGFFTWNHAVFKALIKKENWIAKGLIASEYLGKKICVRIISVNQNQNSVQIEIP